MIYLDLIWLYTCIIFVSTRPIFESVENEIDNKIYKIDNENKIIKKPNSYKISNFETSKDKYNSYGLLKDVLDNIKTDKFERVLFATNKSHKSHMSPIDNGTKFENSQIQNPLDSLKDIYGVNDKSHDFDPYLSYSDLNYFSDLVQTENVLNKVKELELEIVSQKDPYIRNLITSSTTGFFYNFRLEQMDSSLYNKDNGYMPKYTDIYSYHNKRRSLKDEAVTMAQNIEGYLQNVCKKIVHKICKDEKKNKTCTPAHNVTNVPSKVPKKNTTIKPCKMTMKVQTNLKTNPKISSSSQTKSIENHPSTEMPVTDYFTMLSVYEQMLTKLFGQNTMDFFTIQKGKEKKNTKRDANNISGIIKRDDYYDMTEGTINMSNNFGTPTQINPTPREINFHELSSKISYNDYVNGYKYYLNFQKQQRHDNFSNLVRYQAHRHHNVDDIGKYILNKIPQISSTRSRRDIIDYETLDDHDLSTKSDDSWFRKHFFVFLDRNTAKKFHSTEMVTFKSTKTKEKRSKIIRKVPTEHSNYKINNYYGGETETKSVNWAEDSDEVESRKKEIYYSGLLDQDIKQEVLNRVKRNELNKSKKDSIAQNDPNPKHGVVQINLINRTNITPSAQNVEGSSNKYSKLFQNFHICKNKFKKINKRHDKMRYQRYNPFKEIKKVLDKLYQPDVVTDDYDMNSYRKFKFGALNPSNLNKDTNIREMLKQIPKINSINSNLDYPYSSTYKYDQNLIDSYIRNITIKTFTKNGNQKSSHTGNMELDPQLIENIAAYSISSTDSVKNNVFKVTDKYKDKFNIKLKINYDDILSSLNGENGAIITNKDKSYTQLSFTDYLFTTTTAPTVWMPMAYTSNLNLSKLFSAQADNSVPQYKDISDILKKYIKTTHQTSSKKEAKQNYNFLTIGNFDSTKNIYPYNENKKYMNPLKTLNLESVDNWKAPNLNKFLKNDFDHYTKSILFKKPKVTAKGLFKHKSSEVTKKKTEINTRPAQYFATPIPMPSEEFDKFLKATDIDVESVTAPLPNSLTNEIGTLKNRKEDMRKSSVQTFHDKFFEKSNAPKPTAINKNDINQIRKLNKNGNNHQKQSNNYIQSHDIDDSHLKKCNKCVPIKKFTEKNKNRANSGLKKINVKETTPSELEHRWKAEMYNRKPLSQTPQTIFPSDAARTISPPKKFDYHVLEGVGKKDPLRFSHMTLSEEYLIKNFHRPNLNLKAPIPKQIKIAGYKYNYDVIFNNVKGIDNNNRVSSSYAPSFSDGRFSNLNTRTYNEYEVRKLTKKSQPGEIVLGSSIGNSNKLIIKHNQSTRKETTTAKYTNNEEIFIIPSMVSKNAIKKRDINTQKLSTAKNVGALEVIIDLMNPAQRKCKNEFSNTTNSMQVYIDLPFSVKSEKRSINDNANRTRKIFSAIMSKPVDVKYQILSYDYETTAASTACNKLIPGLYLLLANPNSSNSEESVILQPLMYNVNKPNFEVRQVADSNNIKSFDKKLSTVSIIVQNVNDADSKTWNSSRLLIRNTTKLKRNLKKYFCRSGVCRCKCKANETMCKTCAVNDIVISKLVFEFDNLAQYMKDHCTEIQTYLWMNPTGARQLKDVVRRIDTILNDYNKQVKGKCKGRTCQMIASSIDKRKRKSKPNDVDLGQFDFKNTTETLKKIVKTFNNNTDEHTADTNISENVSLV